MDIPKKIHYCWFGRGPKSELMETCIQSWKKYMPDYEIIEWNEDNFVIDNEYAKQAYENKRYAFVSDYARLKIVYEFGGIYLDTDVELIKSLEPILTSGGYLGFEKKNAVATGLGFAAHKHSEVIKSMLKIYDELKFLVDGVPNQIACPVYNTNALVNFGLELNNTKQQIGDIVVYPTEYFCPLNYDSGKLNITDNTYSIHHYGYSWADEDSKSVLALKRKIFKIFPSCCAQQVFNVINKIRRIMK